ncbi:MAG: sugar ABC transporter permease [Asticcacaulis sp.]
MTTAVARKKADWSGALFVAPYVCVYLALLIYPLLAGMSLSLFKADLFGGRVFVGFENFARLLRDPQFLQAVANTFWFVLLTVPPLTVIPLFIALLLNRGTRVAAFFRGVFFSSSVLSVTIVTLVWRMILMPDGGFIANIRAMFGAAPIPFLSDPNIVMVSMAIITVWWCLGLPMMLYLAALQQVPKDIYEAAALDNASWLRTLWSITLPSLRRIVVLVAILQVRAAIPAVRPAATDHPGRTQRRLAADRAVHLRGRLPPLGHRLCRRRLADPVRPHPDRHHGAVLCHP